MNRALAWVGLAVVAACGMPMPQDDGGATADATGAAVLAGTYSGTVRSVGADLGAGTVTVQPLGGGRLAVTFAVATPPGASVRPLLCAATFTGADESGAMAVEASVCERAAAAPVPARSCTAGDGVLAWQSVTGDLHVEVQYQCAGEGVVQMTTFDGRRR